MSWTVSGKASQPESPAGSEAPQLSKEAKFYETFLAACCATVKSSEGLVQNAFDEASTNGPSAVDALHIAAAREGNCSEFVTAEKEEKSSTC